MMEAMYLIRESGYLFEDRHGGDYLALPEEKVRGSAGEAPDERKTRR